MFHSLDLFKHQTRSTKIKSSGPSGAPTFLRSKISTLSTSLDVYWEPPSMASINGEFLGYILSYRPQSSVEFTRIEVRDESLKTQV